MPLKEQVIKEVRQEIKKSLRKYWPEAFIYIAVVLTFLLAYLGSAVGSQHVISIFINSTIFLLVLVLPFYGFAHADIRESIKNAAVKIVGQEFGSFERQNPQKRYGSKSASLDQVIIANTIQDRIVGEYKSFKVVIEERMAQDSLILDTSDGSPIKSRLSIIVDLPKKVFDGHTIVVQRLTPVSTPLDFSGLKSLQAASGLKDVTFPDPEFSSRFKVLSNDQTEARYLVDPAVVEKLMNFEHIFKIRSFKAEFKNDRMSFVLETGHDHFDSFSFILFPNWDGILDAVRWDFEIVTGLIDTYCELFVKKDISFA